MPDSRKPLKRSPHLQPLSRQHHEGLLAVWKIREGLRNGTAQATIAGFAQWFWDTHLQAHVQREEKWLVPLLPTENLLVQKMLNDHKSIESLFQSATAAATDGALRQLADALEAHIRFEERELFPFIESIVAEENLAAMYPFLEAFATGVKWTDEFWAKKMN